MGFDYISLAPDKFVLPNGWRVCKVQDVAVVNEQSIQRGYKYEWIEYIDIASVEKGTVKSMETIPIKKAPSRARRIVRDKDTLIATVRPNLEHYVFLKVAKPNTIASTGFAVVTAKKVEPRYLYYYLTSPPFTEYLTRIADSHTSTYPAFNPEVIENAELLLPPEAYQRAIAHILGTLDDKIELNRKMNETLEAIARAIFKSWFIDFDPVRAKAEGRDPGLPKEIADLFPDSFEDSELGEIPKGWRVGTVQDLGDVICGKTPPTSDKDNYGSDVPFVTIPDMHGKVFVTKTEKTLSNKGAETQKNKFLPPFSICVSCIATPGLVALTSTQCQTNQQINSVIPSNPQTSLFCYFALRGLGERIRTHGAGGSVLLNLNKGQFSSMKLILPPEEESKFFQKVMLPILQRILNNENESAILSAIRDALLPKLISGEIRVKDAERFLEEAL